MRTLRQTATGAMVAIAMAASSVGCASKTGTGAVVGTGAGALAGAAIGGDEGAVIGALLGAAVGAGIGAHMDAMDRQRAAAVLEATPTYETATWENPDTGAAYQMTPQRTYTTATGEPCREFTMTAFIGGQPEETWGTACRQADGSWRIVDTQGI